MALCHLTSYGGALASGMSWPLNITRVVAALEHRPEPQIWLDGYRRNTAQQWAPYDRVLQRTTETTLIAIEYTAQRVAWQRRHAGPTSWRPAAAWFEFEDPPLVHSLMDSTPAKLMRKTGLTKKIAAAMLSEAMSSMLSKSLTADDWKLEMCLNIKEPAIMCRRFSHPLKKWEQVATRTSRLEAPQ